MNQPLTRQPITRSLRHASVQDLAAVVQTQKRQTVDLLVPASNIRVNQGLLEIAAQDPVLRADGVLDINGSYRMTTNADGQLAEKLGIPVKYQRKLHDEFVSLYNPANRHKRKPTRSDASPEGRWRVYGYDELMSRDKASLDIFWLKDDSLADSENLPSPDVIAQEIVDDLEAALEQFRLIADDLREPGIARSVAVEPVKN